MGLPRKYISYEMGPYNYCKIYKFNETYIAYKITVESWNDHYWNSIKVVRKNSVIDLFRKRIKIPKIG